MLEEIYQRDVLPQKIEKQKRNNENVPEEFFRSVMEKPIFNKREEIA